MRLTVDIEKMYGDFKLKSNFSVDNERFALLGTSGCGKTLTLKCISGIEKPDRGIITLGDKVLFDSEKKINVPSRQRETGFLFQNYALFPNMTVRQNLYCVAKDKKFADELLDRFCINDVADKFPSELSGGQSQRTALARLLVTKPTLLLLDEPFSALDNYMRARVEHEILDLLDEFDGPSIMVTHDRNEAYRMSDRIAVMDNGNIVEVQSRNDFFDHPDTVAAARLTGCKNITRISKNEDGSFRAVDWGMNLEPAVGKILKDGGYAGYRAHFFSYVEKDAEELPVNYVRCNLVRVIEDTFSIVICFKSVGNESEEPDSLMTWITDKEEWEKVKDEVMNRSFILRLDPANLMTLK